LSTATWYACAIGSSTDVSERPWLNVIRAPRSFVIAKRSGAVGSIQMSWLSPPQGTSVKFMPPSFDWKKLLLATSTSSAFPDETARRM